MPYKYAFQLALLQADLQFLPRLGIPFPIEWNYLPYARQERRGNGQIATFGFPTAFWRWDVIAQYQLDRILRLFSLDTDASQQVFIRTYTDRGATLETVIRQCVMIRPIDGSGKSLVPRSKPHNANYTDITLNFSRLEVP